jgi:hypothetical protein
MTNEKGSLGLGPISFKHGKIDVSGMGVKGMFETFEGRLSRKTQENLQRLSAKLGITWEEVYKFRVKQIASPYRAKKTWAWSVIVRGIDEDDNWWIFWRRETEHPGAGQTLLYYEGAKPRKVSAILHGNVDFNEWPLAGLFAIKPKF